MKASLSGKDMDEKDGMQVARQGVGRRWWTLAMVTGAMAAGALVFAKAARTKRTAAERLIQRCDAAARRLDQMLEEYILS